MRKLFLLGVVGLSALVLLFSAPVALAMDVKFYMGNDILNYDENFDECALGTGLTPSTSGSSNKDYLGRDILTKAQLEAIEKNRDAYEKAATEAGIPWEMIAAIHLRETGLSRINPANGQGIFQNSTAPEGLYPEGEVDDAGFLAQAKWVAAFIKGKATDASRLSVNDEVAIKDTFFAYNGRDPQYIAQAKTLGFTDSYDGSPYVMNKADAKRDPGSNPKWGQVKGDGGEIQYPANQDYGAFLVYASLAGLSSSCGSGDLQQKIVSVAEAELKLWEAGTMKPGKDFTKYSYGPEDDWCAWFVSWVLKEAGSPVNDSAQPTWSLVSQFFTIGVPENGYTQHINDGSYTPQPGDLAIYGGTIADDVYHINIVVGMNGSQVITIGGNEGAGGNGSFTQSKVVKNEGFGNDAAMFITVK